MKSCCSTERSFYSVSYQLTRQTVEAPPRRPPRASLRSSTVFPAFAVARHTSSIFLSLDLARAGFAFEDRGAERGQLGILFVVPGHIDIEKMPHRFRAAVHGVMFGCGNDPQILRVLTLHSTHDGDTHARSEKRIFPIRFLTPRIAENVQVRRPEIQTHSGRVTPPQRFVMLRSCFGSNGCSRFLRQPLTLFSFMRPIGSGKTVAMPLATPCKASFDQL
jgi:hypothetical protein